MAHIHFVQGLLVIDNIIRAIELPVEAVESIEAPDGADVES